MAVALAFTRLAAGKSAPTPPQILPAQPKAFLSSEDVYAVHITILRLDADTTESEAVPLDGTGIPRPMLPLRDARKEHSVETTIR